MTISTNQHSKWVMAAATIILSANIGFANDLPVGHSKSPTRGQFHTKDYNHICPLAVYNDDYRSVLDAKTSGAIAGQFQNKQTKPTQSLEASNG